MRDKLGKLIKGHKMNTGGNHPMYGKHHSEETKGKISEAEKGKKISEETKKKLREANIGKHPSVETKTKMSNARKRLNLKGEKHPNWKGGKKEAWKRRRNKLKNNLKFQLNKKIANGILKSLKRNSKNGRTWQSLVDYNVKQLKRRLNSTMPDGYSWEDFMAGKLHIDHIIPISVFNFENPEHIDFKRCWKLNNLRLLPAIENIKKSNKIIKPLQISLKIAGDTADCF